MSKIVTFIEDVYPYCVGDVIVLSPDELKAVDEVAKFRKRKVYEAGAKNDVDSTVEHDRQQVTVEEAQEPEDAEARRQLEEAEAEKADAQGHASASGRTVAGTSAGTSVQTAAAHKKR